MRYAQLYLLVFVYASAYSMDGLRRHQQHGALFYATSAFIEKFNNQDIAPKITVVRYFVREQILQLPAQLFDYVVTMHETECWPLEKNSRTGRLALPHPTIENLQLKTASLDTIEVNGTGISQKVHPKGRPLTGIQWDPEEPYTFYAQYGYHHGQVEKYVYNRALLEHYFSQDATYPQMVMVYALLKYRSESQPTYVQDAIDTMNNKLGPENSITDATEWINTQKTLPRYVMTALNRALCLKMCRS